MFPVPAFSFCGACECQGGEWDPPPSYHHQPKNFSNRQLGFKTIRKPRTEHKQHTCCRHTDAFTRGGILSSSTGLPAVHNPFLPHGILCSCSTREAVCMCFAFVAISGHRIVTDAGCTHMHERTYFARANSRAIFCHHFYVCRQIQLTVENQTTVRFHRIQGPGIVFSRKKIQY